jgi:hypothetical protein
MIVSLAIAKEDAPEAHRKKRGDIVAVMPQGHKWGRKELENCHIVELEVDFDELPDARKLAIPLYEDGSLSQPEDEVKALAKRRYRLGDLTKKNFHFTEVEDKALKRRLTAGDTALIRESRTKKHLKNIKL